MVEQPLILVHIPKAAGFTLKHLFTRIYGERNSVIDLHIFQNKKQLFENRHYDFIEGHLPFGIHKHVGRPCQYLTLLRDPYKRVLSHYNHVLTKADHPLHLQARQGLSLDQVFDRGLFPVQFQNTQTRMIAGGEHFRAPEIPAENLDLARRHLAEVFLFGLVEEFDVSLELWRQQLGFGIPQFESLNRAQPGYQRQLQEAIDKTLIERYNTHDRKLYTFARGLFREQKRRRIEELLLTEEGDDTPVHELTVNGAEPDGDGRVRLSEATDCLDVRGWAIDRSQGLPLHAVVTECAGVRDLALYGRDRLGIAHRFENYLYRYCGFEKRIRVEARRLQEGISITLTFVGSRCRFSRQLHVYHA